MAQMKSLMFVFGNIQEWPRRFLKFVGGDSWKYNFFGWSSDEVPSVFDRSHLGKSDKKVAELLGF